MYVLPEDRWKGRAERELKENFASPSAKRKKGGSKYGVHQGNGDIWMLYIYIFIFCLFAESPLVKEMSSLSV